MKSCDINCIGIMRLYCCECDKEFGSNSSDHDKSMITNLFTNFNKSHLSSTAHIRSWCLWKDLDFSSHPMSASKGKSIVITIADHKRLITKGIKTLEAANSTIEGSMKPFTLISDPDNEHLKSFYYKVKCLFCNDFFQLCPP